MARSFCGEKILPCLNDIINEIQHLDQPNAPDRVRADKLVALQQYIQRNIICYYSNWLNTEGQSISHLSIEDMDKNGFMNAVEGLDCSKGLDLLLHTSGGSTFNIVNRIDGNKL
jgi:ClpP class serine protease